VRAARQEFISKIGPFKGEGAVPQLRGCGFPAWGEQEIPKYAVACSGDRNFSLPKAGKPFADLIPQPGCGSLIKS